MNSLSIRDATPADASAIYTLAQTCGLGELSCALPAYIAEENGYMVGFLRITMAEGIAYVNPIAVTAHKRTRGIGRMLMNHALRNHKELRFVARGYAVAFYEKIGCSFIPWDDIASVIAADCDSCEDVATCHPTPMRYTLSI